MAQPLKIVLLPSQRLVRAPPGGADTFPELRDIVAHALEADAAARIVFKYMDDDGDVCSLSSDTELREAYRITAELGKPALVMVAYSEAEIQNPPQLKQLLLDVLTKADDEVEDQQEEVDVAEEGQASAVAESISESPVSRAKEEEKTHVEPASATDKGAKAKQEEDVLMSISAAMATSNEKGKQMDETAEETKKDENAEEAKSAKEAETAPRPVSEVSPFAIGSTLEPSSATISRRTGWSNAVAPITAGDLFAAHAAAAAADSSSSTSSSAFMLYQPVHVGVACVGCPVAPIVGTRYKCLECRWDACEQCETSFSSFSSSSSLCPEHAREHLVLRIQRAVSSEIISQLMSAAAQSSSPSPSPFASPIDESGRRKATVAPKEVKPEEPKARFVEDTNVPDRSVFAPGAVVRKGWRLQNTGKAAWPEDVCIQFVGGTIIPSERLTPAPRAQPGETVEVYVNLQMPEAEGPHQGWFRLATNTFRFGPRLWIEAIVSAPFAAFSSSASSSSSSSSLPSSSTPSPSASSDIPAAEPRETKRPTAVAEPTPAVTYPEAVRRTAETPEPGATSHVDASAAPRPKDPALAAAAPLAASSSPASSNSSSSSAPSSSSSSVPSISPDDPNAATLKELHAMGYRNHTLNGYLLAQFKGDLARVVDWLINHSK